MSELKLDAKFKPEIVKNPQYIRFVYKLGLVNIYIHNNTTDRKWTWVIEGSYSFASCSRFERWQDAYKHALLRLSDTLQINLAHITKSYEEANSEN